MNDTIICIVDKRKEKTIFIYSNDGKYKTKICQIGRVQKNSLVWTSMPGHSEQYAEVIVTDLWGVTISRYIESATFY